MKSKMIFIGKKQKNLFFLEKNNNKITETQKCIKNWRSCKLKFCFVFLDYWVLQKKRNHMRHRLFLHYWWFLHNLKKLELIRTRLYVGKEKIFLEQREVAFVSPSKIYENLNFCTEIHIFANFAGC